MRQTRLAEPIEVHPKTRFSRRVLALANALAVSAVLLAVNACQSTDESSSSGLGHTRDSEHTGDAGSTTGTGVKVVLVGIDGASFAVLDPLLESGELPQLEGLITNGARGHLRSQEPMLSPALWTTVVTGRSRAIHGIEHFVRNPDAPAEEQILVSSVDRRSLALWNILSGMQRSVGLSGWWASWPAEAVDGWIVSDRLNRSRWAEWKDGSKQAGATYPNELADEIRPLLIDPMTPDPAEIAQLVEMTPPEWSEFEAAKKPIFGHGFGVFKFAYANQRSHEEIVLYQLERAQPDLLAFLLIANDPISHTFWHYYEPERFPGVDIERARRLGAIVPAISRHNDRFLSRLLPALDEDTVVLIVSDHGFQASGRLPKQRASEQFGDWFEQETMHAAGNATVTVGQPGKHHPNGVLIASGGPIRAGVRVEGARLLDLTPTILALLGLPVADDMQGRVLTEMIDPQFLARHPVRSIPSFEELIRRDDAEALSDDDTETLEMLRSLGYLN